MRTPKIDMSTLAMLTESVDSALENLRGYAHVKDLRATLVIDDVEVEVTVPEYGEPSIVITIEVDDDTEEGAPQP